MVDKGCDNCYYTYFDEKAYPCSLCIRGVERTDKWQPSRKTENSSEKLNNCETCRFELYCPEMCEGCCEWDSHYEPKERSSE